MPPQAEKLPYCSVPVSFILSAFPTTPPTMHLQRLRAYFKERFSRGSIPYRVARFVYQMIFSMIRVIKPRQSAREIVSNSIFTREDEIPMCSLFPKEELELVMKLFRPRTLLDVGCGTGLSMDYFIRHGVDVLGIEGSELAISKSRHPHLIRQADLHNKIDLNKKFDVVWCFEVAEHIHPDFADALTETVALHGDVIILSAAQPGQGGCGHLNEQPPHYWITKFENMGFALNREATQEFQALEDQFAPNILVFHRVK